jgi:hypothetical protein
VAHGKAGAASRRLPGPHPASAATAFEVLSGRPAVPTAGAPWSPPASNSGITPGRSGRSRTSRWSSPGRSREPNFLPKTQVLCTAAPLHRCTAAPLHRRTAAPPHRAGTGTTAGTTTGPRSPVDRVTASPRHRVTAPSARPPDHGRPPDHRASPPRTPRTPRTTDVTATTRALRHGRHEALPLRDSAPAAPVAQTGDWRFSTGAPTLLRLCALERRPRRPRRPRQCGRQRACRAGPTGPDQLRARTQIRSENPIADSSLLQLYIGVQRSRLVRPVPSVGCNRLRRPARPSNASCPEDAARSTGRRPARRALPTRVRRRTRGSPSCAFRQPPSADIAPSGRRRGRQGCTATRHVSTPAERRRHVSRPTRCRRRRQVQAPPLRVPTRRTHPSTRSTG